MLSWNDMTRKAVDLTVIQVEVELISGIQYNSKFVSAVLVEAQDNVLFTRWNTCTKHQLREFLARLVDNVDVVNRLLVSTIHLSLDRSQITFSIEMLLLTLKLCHC